MKYYRLLYFVAVIVARFDWTGALFGMNDIPSPVLAVSGNVKNSLFFGATHYGVTFKTLNVLGIGYTGSLFMRFTDSGGKVSDVFTTPFVVLVPGLTLPVELWIKKGFGTVKTIEIWINNPGDPLNLLKWGAELIKVTPKSSGIPVYFPCVRKIKQGSMTGSITYKFDEFNTYLPQNEPRKTHRLMELEDNKKVYAFSTQHLTEIDYKGTPLIKTIPFNELFPLNYTGYSALAIILEGGGNLLERKGKQTWDSYEDMKHVFKEKIFGKTLKTPLYINKDFTSDVWFGRQRLQGPNPALIKLAKNIPDTFDVAGATWTNLLEGKTLTNALSQNKIFIIDLKIQNGFYENYKINVSAPIALFYLNDAEELLPVAIQLFQGIRESNPVFTPNDDRNVWQNAKNHFQVADGNHHESITHLGTTHLLIEGVIGCTYQNLAHNHPVFRLLRPHFLSTLAINKLAFSSLVAKGTAIDLTISITGSGMKRLAGLGLRDYNMTRDAIVPTMFEEAEVTEDKLKDYPFRDDFSLVYYTIREFVKQIVELYYADDDVLQLDTEIQAWRRQLTAPIDKGVDNSNKAEGRYGLGLKGVPGTDDGFSTREELIEVITVFIHTASTKHAAINFLQFDWYAFAPHHPLYLTGPFPTSKAFITEREILNQFALKNRFLNLVLLVDVLSNRLTQNLGYPEVPMFFDPRATNIVDEYHRQLDNAHREVERRNKVRQENRYIWCDVNRVPNAISI